MGAVWAVGPRVVAEARVVWGYCVSVLSQRVVAEARVASGGCVSVLSLRCAQEANPRESVGGCRHRGSPVFCQGGVRVLLSTA
eukprot:1547320-Rhodomonas_salina.2